MGQPAFRSPTDARFAVAFISAGDVQKSSYIADSVFENLQSTAIGAYRTDGLNITGNVIYNTAGSGEFATKRMCLMRFVLM